MYKIDILKKLKMFLILFSQIILIKFFTNKKRKMDSGNKLEKEIKNYEIKRKMDSSEEEEINSWHKLKKRKKHSNKLIDQGWENSSSNEGEKEKNIQVN